MTFHVLLSFAGVLLCGGLAVLVLVRGTRSFAHGAFAAGMIALGMKAVFLGLSAQAAVSDEVIRWQCLRVVATAFLLGTWLLFSLSFARANYQEFVTR